MTAAEAVVYLEIVVPVMRRLGVTDYDGLSLGPDPHSSAGDEEPTQQSSSPIEQERRAREQQRRILTSGGPRLGLVQR